MKKRYQKVLLITCLALLAFFLCANLASFITYKSIFKRYEGNESYEVFDVNDFEGYKHQKVVNYDSKNTTLCGYYYQNNDYSPIVVISCGLNRKASEMMAVCDYFYDNDYNVFIYDNSGCGMSSGNQMGFYQSLIDLEYTLNYLNTNEKFKDYKKLLFGHSAGGFASTAIFNITEQNILASVSVAAYNDAGKLMVNKGKDYAGFVSYLGQPSINMIQNKYFKEYLSYTSISGINNTNIPIYLAHGNKDQTINILDESIIGLNKLIINPLVTYKEYDDTHTSIIFSKDRSLKYLNMDLFENVLNFYNLHS